MKPTSKNQNQVRPNPTRTIIPKSLVGLLAGCLIGAVLPTANAASDSWTGGTDGTWATPGNWLGGNVPGTGDTATFNAASANTTIDLGGGVTISNVAFSTASAAPYTIGSGAVGSQTLTLDNNSSISVGPLVANNQLFNANLSLAPSNLITNTISNTGSSLLTIAGAMNFVPTSTNNVLRVTNTGNVLITGAITETGAGDNALLKTGTGTLTLSGGSAWSGSGAIGYAPTSAGFPLVAREGTLLLNGGTHAVTGELVVGGVSGTNGGAGQNAKLTVSGSTLNVSSWFSLGRGNGIGGVSTDLVATNAAVITAANLSAGFNGGTGNFPKGSMTIGDTSSFTVTGNGAVNFAESTGSDMTMNLNGSAQFVAAGTGAKNLGQSGKGTINLNGSSSMILGNATSYIGREFGTGIVSVASSATFANAGELRVGGSSVSGSGRLAYGSLTTSGNVSVGALSVGRGNNNANEISGDVIVNGGTFTCTNDVVLGFAGTNSYGKLTLNGGTFNFAPTGARWLIVGWWDWMRGQLDVNGGTLNLFYESAIKMSRGNTVGDSQGGNVVNLNSGFITAYLDGGTNIGGGGNLDLMQTGNAAVTNTFNLNGGVLTIADVRDSVDTGTPIFNFNGGTLRAAATDGRNLMDLGSANARVNVRNGGAIIDIATGKNVPFGEPLLHSDIAGDNAVDGGLTKTGDGKLTLQGGYSYTGPTTISAGELVIDATLGTGNGNLNLTGGTLSLGLGNGTYSVVPTDLTFSGISTLNLNYGTVSGTPAIAIQASGNLSASGTTTINISAIGLGLGTHTLIYTGGGIGSTNGFVLGSLPSGVTAVLTNASANTLDLLVTVAGNQLTWYGHDGDGITPRPNWDISTSTNWYDNLIGFLPYQQYSGIGDNVTFDDSGVFVTNVILNTTVSPATMNVSAFSTPYSITGSGSIAGAVTLQKTNDGSIFLGTANTYTGGTVIGGGSLIVTNDNALGNAANSVTLLGGTLEVNGVTSARTLNVQSGSSVSVASGSSSTLSGVISGSGALSKTGDGTLTISGTSTNQGNLSINAGRATLTGTVVPSAMTVGGGVGNAVLDLSSGTITTSNLFVGNANGGVGAVYQTGGTVNIAGGTGDLMNLGNSDGTYGYYNAAGGIINTRGISIGGENNPSVWPPAGNNAYGLMEVNGATINNDLGWITLSRGGQNNIGVLNVNSGSLTYGDGGIGCNWQLTVDGTQISIINVRGGTLSSTNTGVDFRTANVGILNLNGGLLQTANVTGSGDINFNGGTIRPVGNNGAFMNVSSNIYIYSGGATIDDNGYNLTVAKPLLAPSGNGLSGISIDVAGSGYVAPPILTITGDGRGASAIAQIDRTTGSVTNVIITSRGENYTFASVIVTGGGATSPASFSATGFSANTSGGLTKMGAGTLSLTGSNTYAGDTVIGAGTLSLTPVHQNTSTTIQINNSNVLTIQATGNNVTRSGGLRAGVTGSDVAELSIQLSAGTNPVAPIYECGTLTLNGALKIRVSGLLNSGTFPVLKYTGAVAGSGSLSTTALVPHGYSGVVSNDTASSTIYVTLSGAGGIFWKGTNTDPALTNLWKVGVTNWISGIVDSDYLEGDKVLFNDSGTPTVLLSNAVSPSGVTFSNTVAYTVQGPGSVSSVGNFTKVNSGSVALNVPGTYGTTVLSNGPVSLGANQTFANLGGNSAITNTSAATMTVNNSANTAYSGPIRGSLALSKTGTGTLSLSDGYSGTGDVLVNGGSLDLGGSGSVNSSRLFVGTGGTGTVNINTGNTVTNNYNAGGWWANYALALGVDNGNEGTLNMSGGIVNETGRVWVGNWGGTGHWNQTGGTANISAWIFVGGMQDNNTAQPNGSIGTAIVSNATLSAGNVVVGGGGAGDGANPGAVATSRVKGDMTVANGGVVNSEGDLQVGRSGEGSSGWGSYGTLNIENGGIVNVASTVTRWMTVGRYNSIDATVNIKSGGTLNLNAGTDLQINEGNNTGIRVVNVAGLLQGTAAGGSYIDLNRNGTAGGTTTFNITNGGVVAVDAIVGKANCTLNFNNGTLKATASDANFIGSGYTVNILPGGAILDTDGRNPTVPGNLLNNGIDADGGLTKNGLGTLFLNGINTYTNVTTVNAGTLGGTGAISGPVTVAAAGTLTGGASVGTLTINNNLTLAGNLAVELDKSLSPSQSNDVLAVTGTATYTGSGKSVIVTNLGPALAVGDTFKLFSGTLANGQNMTISYPQNPSVVWTNELATLGQIRVLSVAPPINPNPGNIAFTNLSGAVSLTWTTNAGWFLQVQTNSRSIGLSNNWFDVSGSTSITSTNITINKNDPTLFFRLRKP